MSLILVITMSSCQPTASVPTPELPQVFPAFGTTEQLWEVKSERSPFGKHACELANGDIVVVGSSLSSGLVASLYVAKFSSDGQLRWDSTFAEHECTNGTRVTQLVDGSILVITTSSDGGVSLIDLSLNGDVQWVSAYQSKGSRYIPYSVQSTPDGGVVLCGLNDIDYEYDDGFVLKFDATGKFLWSRAIRSSEADAAEAICLTQDGSNDILISGHSKAGHQDLFVNRYSQDGEVIWQKVLPIGSSYPGMGLSYDRNSDRYIVAGGMSYDSESLFGSKFIYLDQAGNLRDERIYQHSLSFPQGLATVDSGIFIYENTRLHYVGSSDTSSRIFTLANVGAYQYFLTRLSNGDFLILGSTPPFANRPEARLLLRRIRIH
jgi:hypothetical protein